MSLISCHSPHVLSLRHSSHVIHLKVPNSCHSSYVSISCHPSHVTHLMSHHYVTHLTSHHCVTDTKLLPLYSLVATFNFCPWTLPTSQRIILPVISAQPLRSNLCQPYSLFLPRRIRIGFQGVSHSSQYLSHVTHLMSHHYVTYTKLLPIHSLVATFNFCPWPLPIPQRPAAQKDRNRVSGCLSLISVSISCHSAHVLWLRHSAWPQGIRQRLSNKFIKGFRKGNSQKV